jgi:hypothetical protein
VKKYENVPLIVNAGLHKNIIESLLSISGPDRQIILLPIGRSLQVNLLYVTSVVGYVPFDRRDDKCRDHSHGKFSPSAIQAVRTKIAHLAENAPTQVWPEKIYLRRNSGTRKFSNTKELEVLFGLHGYISIEPEQLTFIQQVQLFTNAKEVVAPTGAALANAIFCKTGTRIGVLMAKHERMIFRYWLNLLAPLKIEVVYTLGTINFNQHLGIHADFFINRNDMINYLNMDSVK